MWNDVYCKDLLSEIARDTGYSEAAVREIYEQIMSRAKQRILDGYRVYFHDICRIEIRYSKPRPDNLGYGPDQRPWKVHCTPVNAFKFEANEAGLKLAEKMGGNYDVYRSYHKIHGLHIADTSKGPEVRKDEEVREGDPENYSI